MKISSRLLNLLIVMAFLLGACNLPKSGQPTQETAALTAAAQTVQAQFLTLTALSGQLTPTPSLTPVPNAPTATLMPIQPTATTIPSATPTCDLGRFISDVNIPDGTIMTPGQAFTKTWRLQNIGACAWTGYSLVFDTGDAMNGPATSAIPTTVQNGFVDISVNLSAPTTPGSYRGYWRIRNASGVLFPIVAGFNGKSFYVDIKVQNTLTATPTSTPVAFAVTSVTYTVSSFDEGGTYVSCPMVTAHITTNGPGDVTYHWVRSDVPEGTITITFGAAGTKNIKEKWYLGSAATGAHWMGIFIDDPNNQSFGHTDITPCTSP